MMSLKAVELQIAVPRTSEAGKYQSEYRHRAMNEQSHLGEQAMKDADAERNKPVNVSESSEAFVKLKDQEEGQQQSQRNRDQKTRSQTESAEEPKAEHPYKGHHLDLSL
ncbi:hypothetical protein D3C74_02920 [compost metagenome]